MNPIIDILVVHDGSSDEEVLRALLSGAGELNVVGFFDGLGYNMPPAHVLVIACGTYNEEAAAFIREGVEENPGRPVVLITQGAPGNETRTVVSYIVERGLAQNDAGRAAAMSVTLTLMLIVVSLANFRIFRYRED